LELTPAFHQNFKLKIDTMRGMINRQKDVAGMLRRRQKQNRPAPALPAPPRKAKPPSPKKNKSE
jgi:hypothetical protein